MLDMTHRSQAVCVGLVLAASMLIGNGVSQSAPAPCSLATKGTSTLDFAAEYRLLALVNQYRWAHGLHLVSLDTRARYSLYAPRKCSALNTVRTWKASPSVRHVLLLPALRRIRFITKLKESGPPAVVVPKPKPGPPDPPVTPPNPPVEPPPVAPPPPGTPPTIVGVPYTCNGPVDNIRVVGTGSSEQSLVNLTAGCTGTISFDLTITSGGGDGAKVQAGAHDLIVGPSRVVCQPGVPARSHQDGVQVQGGTNITFYGLFVSCPSSPGAAAFYIDGKDFHGISNVICDGCDLTHMVLGALFTAPAPGSGVRNSVIHQGTITNYYYDKEGTGYVDENNTLAPR